jgi:glycosyltransferase involved in cell wall biosynthesis
MKIVITTGIFPPDVGGPATFVPMIAERWSERHHAVSVVTYSDVAEADDRPYRVFRIPRALPVALRYLSYFFRVRREAREAGVVFAQDGVASGFPAWLAARGRSRFALKIVGDFAWEHARVQHDYEGDLEEFQKDQTIPLRIRLMRGVQRFVACRADLVIVPSRYLADVVRKWGVKDERLRVIYNGVEPEDTGEAVDKRPHRIVTAGRLVSWKGFDTLIGALPKVLEKFPDATLMIVGDGPEEERLRERARILGVEEKVKFVGRLKRAQVSQAIRSAGVFALVSSYEGFSHQLVEAFHTGTPVIASNAGGNAELVREGKNGILVPPRDVRAATRAIINVFEQPEAAAVRAAEALKDVAAFSVDRQIEETTEAVLGRTGARLVIVSRDGSLSDPHSRGAERMRRYAERLERLGIVALAKQDEAEAAIDDVAVRVVDARKGPRALLALTRETERMIAEVGATLVVAQDPFETGLAAQRAASKARIPFIVEEHGGVYLGPYWKNESAKNAVMYRLGLRVLAAADGIRAVSARISDDLRKRFPGKIIRNVPVYSEPIAAADAKKRYAFGYVGRFVPQKNLPLLIRAFRSVHDADNSARLLMVGAGPLEEDLKRIVAEEGVGDNVDWKPFSEDVAAVYAQIKTLVLPSWYEGWGRVVIEAMSCGIPVVMTDVGAANEVLRDAIDGRIVPIDDREKLAEAMKELLDDTKRQMMGAAARQRVAKLEKPEQLAARLTAFWKEIGGV